MTTKLFRIADFVFRLTYPDSISPPKHFLLFEVSGEEPVYIYDMDVGELSVPPESHLTAEREDIKIFENHGKEVRLLSARGLEGNYALYEEISDTKAHITLSSTCLELLSQDTIFNSLLVLERRMLSIGGLILHCACLQYQKAAILFSAPSGVGKSTQASLWEKYRQGETINGDRALLLQREGGWRAYGWPVCGSSEICHNITLPIQAIVMLSQSKTNTITRLNPLQAFTELYGQITINSWNKTAITRVMDIMDSLILKVPVYHLGCTISKEAVDLLYESLKQQL